MEKMEKKSFGEANLYVFENKNGMKMALTDFGATLVSLTAPDRDGNFPDVTLGYDTAEKYRECPAPNFGGIIGRNANRIKDARFVLNGKEYRLDKNDGENNLHSGYAQYNLRKWEVKEIRGCGITFAIYSPDGDQGYPGDLFVMVTYTLSDDNVLLIEYYAKPEGETVINMTNHAYFNLNGHDSGTILGHDMWIDSDAFTATGNTLIPTGKILPVLDTPMDFRIKKEVGRDIDSSYEALIFGGGYDHNWCLNNHGNFKKVAELSSGKTGIAMDVYTDRPGLQVYTGNFLSGEYGKGGARYLKRSGICFETQNYPDAVNKANFPSCIYGKGEEYRTKTAYAFRTVP